MYLCTAINRIGSIFHVIRVCCVIRVTELTRWFTIDGASTKIVRNTAIINIALYPALALVADAFRFDNVTNQGFAFEYGHESHLLAWAILSYNSKRNLSDYKYKQIKQKRRAKDMLIFRGGKLLSIKYSQAVLQTRNSKYNSILQIELSCLNGNAILT